jgi:formamidopyrimidine-DNA glycosylase
VPELPEVETVRRTLAPALGRRVTRVWWSGKSLRLNRPVDLPGLVAVAEGAALARIGRRGKYLVLEMAGRSAGILVHLGMSGRFRLVASSAPHAPHTHVVLGLEDGTDLRFSDTRRFGMVEPLAVTAGSAVHPALSGLGVDPLEDELDPAALHARLRQSGQALKALLLDQRILAGVGNIYASEALFRAGLRPTRRGTALTRPEAERLAAGVVAALRAALDHGGTSLRDFVAADGREGDNARYLRVYDRAGLACLRRGCRGRIRRVVLGGRATFFCPACQPR